MEYHPCVSSGSEMAYLYLDLQNPFGRSSKFCLWVSYVFLYSRPMVNISIYLGLSFVLTDISNERELGYTCHYFPKRQQLQMSAQIS